MRKFFILSFVLLTSCTLSGAQKVVKEDTVVNGHNFYEMIYQVEEPDGNYVQSQYKNAERGSYIIAFEAADDFVGERGDQEIISNLDSYIEKRMKSVCSPKRANKKSGPDIVSPNTVSFAHGFQPTIVISSAVVNSLLVSDIVKYRYVCN